MVLVIGGLYHRVASSHAEPNHGQLQPRWFPSLHLSLPQPLNAAHKLTKSTGNPFPLLLCLVQSHLTFAEQPCGLLAD